MPHKNLLLNFKRPNARSIEYKILSEDSCSGTIAAYPFERGYAITVANSLRRVMLSSLPGYAVVGLSLKYYDDKKALQMLYSGFDNIYGVYEDTIEILQNLKKVRLYLLDSSDEKTLTLEFKGEKTVTAKDLAVDSSVHICNPDQHILTLNSNAHVTFDLTINFGRGYVPAEQIEKNYAEVGFIAIDGMFSPVNQVVFNIDNYRIDQKTDYEQFTLDISTDGSISVGDALADASKILKEHFTAFINFNEEEYDLREGQLEEVNDSPEEDKVLKAMKIKIDELELNARAFNCLESISVDYVGDIVLKSKDELEKTKNLGQKSLEEIKQKLQKLELFLEMSIPESVLERFHAFKESSNEE